LHKLISLLLPRRNPPLQNFGHQEITKEEITSRGLPLAKQGRREDDDDESRRRMKLEKGKEPATKDADEEPFFNDTKFAFNHLKRAFRKLEDVSTGINIKAHLEVDKDPSVKGHAFRIHGLVERLEKLPVVKRVGRHFIFDDGGDDSDGSHDGDDGSNGSHDNDDGSDGSHGGDDGGTLTN
jgi:hypothetical protein